MAPFQYLPERTERLGTPLVSIAILVAALYVGRDVLAPLALALLLTIAALPVVEFLERRRVPRALGVGLVLLVVIALVLALLWLIVSQVYHLAAELPRYETELREKLTAIGSGSGPFEEVGKLFQRLGSAIRPPEGDPMPAVAVVPAPESAFATIGELLHVVLTPAAILAVTLLLMGFVLMQREDLRDRALRLAGTRDLHRTTRVMQEATSRVGRFLLMHICMNAVFGASMGIGLWFLGVPNAPLWGVLGFVLRFIPFLGAPLSALLPAIVAFATSDGWAMVLLVLAWFAVVDIVVTYALEPWLYGASTGVTPLAVVLSAIFWGALWGPVGLILAPAITACLAILGRTMPGFATFDILLSDRPPLAPPERFYQRLLAGDSLGASRMLAIEAERGDGIAALRHLAEPALTRLAEDRREEDFAAAMVLGATRTLLKALELESQPANASAEVAVIGVGGALDQAGAALARVALDELGLTVTDRLAGRTVETVVLVLVGSVHAPRYQRMLAAARSQAAEVQLLTIGDAEPPYGGPVLHGLEELVATFEPRAPEQEESAEAA